MRGGAWIGELDGQSHSVAKHRGAGDLSGIAGIASSRSSSSLKPFRSGSSLFSACSLLSCQSTLDRANRCVGGDHD